jgi:hypothetical protein
MACCCRLDLDFYNRWFAARIKDICLIEGVPSPAKFALLWFAEKAWIFSGSRAEMERRVREALPFDLVRRLTGVRRAAKGFLKGLEKFAGKLKHLAEVNFYIDLCWREEAQRHFQRSFEEFQRFSETIVRRPSRVDVYDSEREMAKIWWICQVPALAYALHFLMRRAISAADAKDRIAKYEAIFLKRNIDDRPGRGAETIKKQLRSFRDSPLRPSLDNLIKHLLAIDWIAAHNAHRERVKRLHPLDWLGEVTWWIAPVSAKGKLPNRILA